MHTIEQRRLEWGRAESQTILGGPEADPAA
jgi:hypothetical protein